MSATEGRWTCPTCGATWVRSDETPHDEWAPILHRVQAAHGQRCRGELQ